MNTDQESFLNADHICSVFIAEKRLMQESIVLRKSFRVNHIHLICQQFLLAINAIMDFLLMNCIRKHLLKRMKIIVRISQILCYQKEKKLKKRGENLKNVSILAMGLCPALEMDLRAALCGAEFSPAWHRWQRRYEYRKILAQNFNGKMLGNVKIWSPNSAGNPNVGGTLVKFGKVNRLNVEVGRMLHFHVKAFGHVFNHIPLGIPLAGIIGGFWN